MLKEQSFPRKKEIIMYVVRFRGKVSETRIFNQNYKNHYQYVGILSIEFFV